MMDNLIEFFRVLLSYVMVFAVYGIVAGVGIFVGIKWRKSKNAKEVQEIVPASEQE